MHKALGKGLEALIPTIGQALTKPQLEGAVNVSVEKIKPNRYQARRKFDDEKLKELAESIREHGLAQPIIISPSDNEGFYELIAGERRLRASIIAGLSEIPSIIRTVSDRERFQISLIENLQREDLNPIEQAEAYHKIIGEFNLTQEELAKQVGKSRPVIANTIRLLNLPPNIKGMVSSGMLSEGQARMVVSIEDEKIQREFVDKIISQNLTVREIEEIVKNLKVKGGRLRIKIKKEPEVKMIEGDLQRLLGTKVEITHRGKRGKIHISFYSYEDFERLIELFKKIRTTRK